MSKTKIYLDTSVISHLQAEDTPEKMAETNLFWSEITTRQDVLILISELTIRELNSCDEPKRSFLFEKLQESNYSILEITKKDRELADTYLENQVLSLKSLDDLMHIAVATLNDSQFIVSWNFKHFVNPKTINAVNALNKINHLREVSIVSPSMMLGGF